MNNPKVYDIVRRHFPEKEYALMQEVRDAAGFGASRSADYIAMNLWPSRGLALHGIEQKTYRSDWTKELKTPEKADAIFKYCDFWWLLTTVDGVAKVDEIPELWGWLHITNGKIKIMKHAPKLTPAVMDRGFLACLMKRAVCKDGFIRQDSIADRIAQAKQEGENNRSHRLKQMEESLVLLQKQFNDFKNFTGIDIGHRESWRQPKMEDIGKAVNFIAQGGVSSIIKDLKLLEGSSERILKTIKLNSELLEFVTTNKESEAPNV